MKVAFKNISNELNDAIHQISKWYFDEWKIPKENTVNNLKENTTNNVIFQTLITHENKLIGTGGLYQRVGIQKRIEKYQNYSPWVALMFMEPKVRGKGLGGELLTEIECEAKRKGFDKIYLFTHTAESLYIRKGWNVIDRYDIEGKDVVIMDKEI